MSGHTTVDGRPTTEPLHNGSSSTEQHSPATRPMPQTPVTARSCSRTNSRIDSELWSRQLGIVESDGLGANRQREEWFGARVDASRFRGVRCAGRDLCLGRWFGLGEKAADLSALHAKASADLAFTSTELSHVGNNAGQLCPSLLPDLLRLDVQLLDAESDHRKRPLSLDYGTDEVLGAVEELLLAFGEFRREAPGLFTSLHHRDCLARVVRFHGVPHSSPWPGGSRSQMTAARKLAVRVNPSTSTVEQKWLARFPPSGIWPPVTRRLSRRPESSPFRMGDDTTPLATLMAGTEVGAVLGIQKMTPGDGYRYFERQITSGDEARPRDCALTDHQHRAGLPPGVWIGRAAEFLGVRGEVTEGQMAALFGEGLHPLADEITAESVRAAASAKASLAAARLGTAYYRFGQEPTQLVRLVEAQMTALETHMGGPLDEAGRDRIRLEVGAKAFLARFGRAPGDARELDCFIQRRTVPARQPVAAWHLTAQPPASITRLWELGDDATRQVVEGCHDEAVAETLRWVEEHALATRAGKNGIVQEQVTTGLVGVRFRHFDSRAGDAGLHDHILVANKVQRADGKWRAIDGRHLLAQAVSASEVYNAQVVHKVCVALDVAAKARPRPDGRRPVMEIAGIDDRLLAAAPQRSTAIRERLPQLLDAYRAKHGREPSSAARVKLLSRATLETRPVKKLARPLPELRAHWRRRAVSAFGCRAVDGVLADSQATARKLDARGGLSAQVDVPAVAAAAVNVVSTHRAVFGRRHIVAEVLRQITRASHGRAKPLDWAEQVTQFALDELCLDLTAPEISPPFAPLQRADGTTIYRGLDARTYTTPALLAAEDAIVAAARTTADPPCSAAVFEYHRIRHTGQLDASQVALARAFATGSRLVVAAIGPAGAGKTAALALAAQALTAAGRRVVALAPSARAAQVLGDALGQPADTLHHWLHQPPTTDARTAPERAGTGPLRPGDTVIIDEAGMAATVHLAAVANQARTAGAHVRLVGDPAQLAAIESGGILRLLQTEGHVVHLTGVHRFRTAGEAEASLRLRDGAPTDAFTWYRRHQRISSGDDNAMLDAAFIAWQSDLAGGSASVMAAPTRAMANALNLRAHDALVTTGHLTPGPLDALLRDGTRAHLRDTVVTRRNERRLTCLAGRDFVKNGDTWTIEAYTNTGAAVVRHTQHQGRLTLPAAYLARHTELGYAATIHRTQGMTVDTTHAVLTSRTMREAAYVAATRGRHANHLYIALEAGEDVDFALRRIATQSDHSPGARQTIRDKQLSAWNVTQLVSEYADAAQRTDELRYRQALHTILGPGAVAVTADPVPPAVTESLAGAERAGLIPWHVLALAHHIEPGATAAGLARHIDRLTADSRAHPQPPWSATQTDLLASLARAHRTSTRNTLQDANEHFASLPAPILVHGRTHPAWPHRPHGHLAKTQLLLALHRARTTRTQHSGADHPVTRNTLEHEHRLRSLMSRHDLAREDKQRHSQQQSDAAPPSSVLRHAMRAAARDQAVAARQTWRQATALNLRGRPSASRNGRPAIPDWLAPAWALNDPFTPADWRQHLFQRRSGIDHHLTSRGTELAADPPAWAQPLGPPPDPADEPAQRADWERIAALTDAWRLIHRLPDDNQAIGQRPPSNADPAHWQHLQDDICRLAHRNPAVPDQNGNSVPQRISRQPDASPQHSHPRTEITPPTQQPTLHQHNDSPEQWLQQIPVPSPDDDDQQRLYQSLVTDCAQWRRRHHVTTNHPLGPAPANNRLPAWQRLTTILDEYTRTRIHERLALSRNGREPDSTPPKSTKDKPTRAPRTTLQHPTRTQHQPPPPRTW